MKKDETKVSVFVPTELHRQAKSKLGAEGSSFQALLTSFLTEWIGGKRSVAITDSRADRYGDDVRLIQWLLEHGTSEDRDRIRWNLRMFEEVIRGRSQNPSNAGVHRQAKKGA